MPPTTRADTTATPRTIRWTAAEWAAVVAAAMALGVTPSDYVRSRALEPR